MPLTPTAIVRVYVPIARRSKALLNARPVRDVLAVIAAFSRKGVGRVGRYAEVVEVGLGYEQFTPLKGSRPKRGRAGVREIVSVAIVTTFVQGATPRLLEEFLDEVARIHPWEHPVIEVYREKFAFLWSPER